MYIYFMAAQEEVQRSVALQDVWHHFVVAGCVYLTAASAAAATTTAFSHT